MAVGYHVELIIAGIEEYSKFDQVIDYIGGYEYMRENYAQEKVLANMVREFREGISQKGP